MKLKVKERFYDKKEGFYVEVKEKGKPNVIERDDERAQVLIEAGVAEPVAEEKPEKEKKAPKKEADEKPVEK